MIPIKYVSCVIVILCIITVGSEQHDIIQGLSRDITVDFEVFSFVLLMGRNGVEDEQG
jgi:hypothetical protein